MRPAILIHGPTASGKTKLAIALAKRLDGEIINADAMQCYADLDILTARPDAEEKAAAPHHLFGHVDAASRYNAGVWSKDAAAKIAELRGQGKVPIIVGGTGLYLLALTDGLSEIPPIPDEARKEARARVEKMMKLGALEEARRLWERKLDPELPAMRAHGMPGFAEHFAGRASLADAIERCKRDTRRYAKRQMTWIAHQFTLWPRIPSLALDVRTRVFADLHAEAQNRVE